jgi:hypothetical protein
MVDRIQLSRAKGWRMPPNTVRVSRPGKWGNPCKVEGAVDRAYAAAAYVAWLSGDMIGRDLYGPPPTVAEIRAQLAGKNLACWCDKRGHCHADALLHLANAPSDEAATELLRRMFVFGPFNEASDV